MPDNDRDLYSRVRRERQNFTDGSKAERPGALDLWTTDAAATSMAGKFCTSQNRFFVDLVDDMVGP